MKNELNIQCKGTVCQAIYTLVDLVKDGLDHGFFDFSVKGEVVNGKKRRLIIQAGKSHSFTISEDELTS